MDALGELVSSGVEAGGGGADALVGIGGHGSVLEVQVGSNEVQELLSAVVSEGVGLNGVRFPTLSLCLDLSNDLLVDGVGFSKFKKTVNS